MEAGTGTDGDADGDTLIGIENLEGSDLADKLYGDAASNRIDGNDGNDTIDGRAGADDMYGDDGDDTYIVDTTDDVVHEFFGYGTDKIKTAITFDLTDAADVEDLVLTAASDVDGIGNELDNSITGNKGANVLKGNDGADYLDGAGGDDTMRGGAGADWFSFAAGFGKDTITDFDVAEDVINLEALNDIFVSFKDLKNHHSTEVGNNLEIDDGDGNVITIRNFSIADLAEDNFVFEIV
jgi:Ca2+-binding RTX toxin-like protein